MPSRQASAGQCACLDRSFVRPIGCRSWLTNLPCCSNATAPFPVVAAINGPCVGAGLGFALACDLRVAAAGLRFSTAFVGIGLTADSGLSATLARAVGASRATELLMLNEPFTAED